MVDLKFQGLPHISVVAQIVGPEINVVTAMPLWEAGKGTPAPGKALVLRVGA